MRAKPHSLFLCCLQRTYTTGPQFTELKLFPVKQVCFERKKSLWDSIFMITTQETVIKTVLNYFLAPARTRQLDRDEKVWKTWEVYFGSLFFWERKDPTFYQRDVCKTWYCKFENLKITMPHPRFVWRKVHFKCCVCSSKSLKEIRMVNSGSVMDRALCSSAMS